MSFLENSSILGERNINYIVNYLNYFGFVVVAFILKAEDYLSPCRRERQYLLVFPLQTEPLDQTADGFVMPGYVSALSEALGSMKSGPGDVRQFLLEKSDPFYVD